MVYIELPLYSHLNMLLIGLFAVLVATILSEVSGALLDILLKAHISIFMFISYLIGLLTYYGYGLIQ